MLDKAVVMNMTDRYVRKIQDVISPKKVVLYGSYAKGQPTTDSDIDIAVIVDSINGINYMNTVQQLYKCRRDISLDIEPVLLSKADDISGFLSEVLSTGIVVYDAEELKETA